MNPWLRDIGRSLILGAKVCAWSAAVLVYWFCLVTGWFIFNGGNGNTTSDTEDTAGQQMLQLEGACKNYIAKNEGQPPDSLDALVTPFNGGLPLIEGGPNALIDPWGKPYQYDPTHVNKFGDPDPLVMTTNSKGEPICSPKRSAGR